MFAALICVISLAMMAQFAIFFWRANMLAIAAEPVSDTLIAAQSSFSGWDSTAFETVAAISNICPAIGSDSLKLWPARAYYQVMRLISRCSAITPQGSAWARQEMAFCAQYAAVSVDRRLSSNQAYMAAMHSC